MQKLQNWQKIWKYFQKIKKYEKQQGLIPNFKITHRTRIKLDLYDKSGFKVERIENKTFDRINI